MGTIRILFAASLVSATVVGVACGGATATDEGGGSGSSTTNDSGSGGSSGGFGSGMSSGEGGGGEGDASSGSASAGSSGGAASGSSSAGSSSSGMVGPVDAGPPRGITCGRNRCDVGEACCYGTGNAMPMCAAECPDGGLSLMCETTSECPMGDVCCATVGGRGGLRGAVCAAQCTGGSVQICTGNGRNECPNGGRCIRTGIGDGICVGGNTGGGGPTDAGRD